MGLYKVPLSMSVLSFGKGTMLANFYMCGIMLVLIAVFNMLVRNASPRGPMCFRCLMFNLSGPCELLFLLCFIDIPSTINTQSETIRNVFGCGGCFVAECYGCV